VAELLNFSAQLLAHFPDHAGLALKGNGPGSVGSRTRGVVSSIVFNSIAPDRLMGHRWEVK
jgi:hypothetical protein